MWHNGAMKRHRAILAVCITFAILVLLGFGLISLLASPQPDLKPCYKGQPGGINGRYRDCRLRLPFIGPVGNY